MHWIAAPETDTATLIRFHPALPPEATHAAIDEVARDRSAMGAWRDAEQMSMVSPPVHGCLHPLRTPAVLRRNKMTMRTEDVASTGKAEE